MIFKTVKTFQASFVIGMYRGYDVTNIISITELKNILHEGQKEIEKQFGFKLSAKLIECTIFLEGQDEPSIELNFIQYPRFATEQHILKTSIIFLAEYMMDKLSQNRTAIVFPEETILLEIDSNKQDKGIITILLR